MELIARCFLTNRHKLLKIIALACPLCLLLLDTAALPVTLPTIRDELHITRVVSQWIMNSFFLANASLVFAGGRLSDIFGHRRMICVGMVIFALGAILTGSAQNGIMLISARVVQGLGGALMGPSAYALLYDHFPIGERGRAVGLMVGISSILVSIGPFLGGVLAECLSWRWLFFLSLPIISLGLFLTMRVFPKSKKKDDTFDFPGFLALTAALGSLSLALMQGKDWGWFSPLIMLLLIFCPLFFYLLLITNRYARHPFLNIELFKYRPFFRGIILLFCIQFIMVIAVMMPLYFQTSFGFSPIKSGLYMIISSFSVIFCGPLSGYLSDHFSPKYPAIAGFSLLTLSLILFAYLSANAFTEGIGLALFLYGCGTSLVMTPTGTATLSCVPATQNGEATGIYNSARYAGSTLGMTLMCSLSNNMSYILFERSMSAHPDYRSMNINAIWEVLSDRIHSPWLLDIVARTAFIKSTNIAFAITCCFVAGVALICLLTSFRFFRDFEKLVLKSATQEPLTGCLLSLNLEE